MTYDELLAEYGEDEIWEWLDDAWVPTECPQGCMVEPDGCCAHGHPSLLIQAGLI